MLILLSVSLFLSIQSNSDLMEQYNQWVNNLKNALDTDHDDQTLISLIEISIHGSLVFS